MPVSPPPSRSGRGPGRRPDRRPASRVPAPRGPPGSGPRGWASVPTCGPRPAGSGPAGGRGRRRARPAASVDLRSTSVGSGRVRERVIVVKSANRTLSVTVRPATAGGAHPGGRRRREPEARAGSPPGRRCRARRSRRRRRSVSRCSRCGRRCGGPGPRRARAGGARSRRRAPAARVGSGVWATSPTVSRPSRCSSLRGLLPHPPQLPDVEGVQDERDDLVAAGRRPRRPAWPTAGQLGDELARGRPRPSR